MWLDRFSAQSAPTGSPPPQHKSFAPAPRRPSHLGPGAVTRPGFSPRSSSLNVSGKLSSSNTSLNSPRLPNGSHLKQQITPPADFTDPLKVLEEIVGRPLHEADGGQESSQDGLGLERPSELIEDVNFGGLGLVDFLHDRGDEYGLEIRDDTIHTAEECEYVYSTIA